MTTKPPSKVKSEDPNKPVAQIYSIVEELKDRIPIINDRYRLGFCLNRYYEGLTGSIHEAVGAAKPESCKIDLKELEKIITEKYKRLNL
ncbi:MAG: hypothetical protein ACRDFC_04950 [Ignavibacteria bacterium]